LERELKPDMGGNCRVYQPSLFAESPSRWEKDGEFLSWNRRVLTAAAPDRFMYAVA
jgi:hypothetical protein